MSSIIRHIHNVPFEEEQLLKWINWVIFQHLSAYTSRVFGPSSYMQIWRRKSFGTSRFWNG